MCIKIESPTAVHVVISRAVIKGGGGVALGITPGYYEGNAGLLS